MIERTIQWLMGLPVRAFAGAVAAGLLAGVFAIGLSPLRPKPFSDGYFHEEAKGLVRAMRGGDQRLATPLIHSPGPAYYYAFPYLLIPEPAGDSARWAVGVAWNCIWLWAAALWLGGAARRVGGELAARLAILGVPVTFFPLYYSAGIASETPAFAAAAGVTAAGIRWLACKRNEWNDAHRAAVAVTIALGALLAMRGNFVLTAPLLVLAGMLTRSRKAAVESVVIAIGGVLLAGAVFWGTARLNAGMGAQTRQDSFLTHILIQGAFQYRSEPLDWRPWEKEARGGSRDYAAYAAVRAQLSTRQSSTGLPLAVVEWQWLKDSWMSDPLAWLRMAPLKAASALWFRISPVRIEKHLGGGRKGAAAAFVISAVLNAPVLVMLFVAMAYSFGRKGATAAEKLMCWGPFLAGLIFVAFTYSEPRYVVPGFGGLAVLAGCAMARKLERGPGSGAGCIGGSRGSSVRQRLEECR